MLKRTFEIAVSATSLIVLAAPLTVVALLVKVTSKGPVFYVQPRIGRQGKPFGLIKFRTMRTDLEGPSVTADGDPRITSVGRLLRACKIDELPQLLNILRGDMGIVGPRPEVERFVTHYTPEQRRILERRPGMAGMAQLVFPHESEELQQSSDPERTYIEEWMPRKLAVDLAYNDRRTFLTDMGILIELFKLVLGSRHLQERENTTNTNNEDPPRVDGTPNAC